MLTNRHRDDHGVLEILIMAFSDKSPTEELTISLAMRVHGGLTWASNHAAQEKPDGNWWFGFDCAHSGDLVPGLQGYSCPIHGDIYRTQSYVVAECQSLAAQLASIKK
jgi:hypothetical protein